MARKVPVFLEPTKDRSIIVFGGGNVAYRKCRQFEGFHITVVADKTVPNMGEVCDEIILDHFNPEDIGGYLEGKFIAVAATDSKALNAAITASARRNGILVNSAHGGGDILLPSIVRKDTYTVAVSSEGSVPAFPPYVARRIDEMLGPEYDLMMRLLTEIRSGLQERVSQQPRRAEYLAEILATEKVWKKLENSDLPGALDIARGLEERYRDQ
ncbi:MAG: bifunctional precorrin-2 dehydrogenase/sirohydrochlorin ferrochelatase [archaeon]|nr:bifunctional precorrin-2 dehydrogenase/sirohydrochlorin ferrochelatase [archaeon]